MDIKLDFVPPWLINFMSRQLIGSGHKLYQKVSGGNNLHISAMFSTWISLNHGLWWVDIYLDIREILYANF